MLPQFSLLMLLLISLPSFAGEKLGGRGTDQCAPGTMVVCTKMERLGVTDKFKVSLIASSYFRDPGTSGDKTLTEINLKIYLQDPENFYGPDSEVPLMLRILLCKDTWGCQFINKTISVVLHRIPGKRELLGTTQFQFEQDWNRGEEVWISSMDLFFSGDSQAMHFDF